MNEPMVKKHPCSVIVKMSIAGTDAHNLFEMLFPTYRGKRVEEIFQFIVVGEFIFAEILKETEAI